MLYVNQLNYLDVINMEHFFLTFFSVLKFTFVMRQYILISLFSSFVKMENGTRIFTL
jgi:hypothetical protein